MADKRETVDCPFCGEEILATAKKCKHCGEFLDGSSKPAPANNAAMYSQVLKYSSGMVIDCPVCWYTGKPKKETPGSIRIELVLWLLLLVPGIIYSVWRLAATKTCKCPKCGNEMLAIHRQ